MIEIIQLVRDTAKTGNETSNFDFYILSATLYCKVSFHTVYMYIVHT